MCIWKMDGDILKVSVLKNQGYGVENKGKMNKNLSQHPSRKLVELQLCLLLGYMAFNISLEYILSFYCPVFIHHPHCH